MISNGTKRALALAVASCFGFAAPAMAETVTFSTTLLGANESPPNDSKATGTADMTYDTETHELTWTIDYKGLTGPAIGAHIHGAAPEGSNAGILVPFETVGSPITGKTTLNGTQSAALLDGKLYVNIHTEAHPGGEVRGQLKR